MSDTIITGNVPPSAKTAAKSKKYGHETIGEVKIEMDINTRLRNLLNLTLSNKKLITSILKAFTIQNLLKIVM